MDAHLEENQAEEVLVPVLSCAEKNRNFFQEKRVFVINLLGAPGAGKTSILEGLFPYLVGKVNSAVILGDVETAKDAQRIADCNVPAVQINSQDGTALDGEMVAKVLGMFDWSEIDLLFVENIGSLALPQQLDFGEDIKMVVISVPEGEDRPAKYPYTFSQSEVCIINKEDLLPYAGVDIACMEEEITKINPDISLFVTSCKEDLGLEGLADWLMEKVHQKKQD
jgi:hydrogenase nickel incorporation protein HypB